MHGLAAAEIVDVWERGRRLTPAARALEVLAAAGRGDDPGELAAGARDVLLAELRALTFGQRGEALVACPACGETVELELSAVELTGGLGAPREPLSVELDGTRVRFRLPSAADLASLSGGDAEAAELALLERCLLEPVTDPSLELRRAVAERMAAEDPAAQVELLLACPGCNHEWGAAFDIASFLWAEIEASAQRLLHDVHVLATAYGWGEAEILALSPSRRHSYMELAAA